MSEMEDWVKETQIKLEATAVNVTIFDQIEIDEVEKRARWMAKRCGKITKSNAGKLMSEGDWIKGAVPAKRNPWGKTAITEMLTIFHERRTGVQRDSVSTFSMRWGLENEYPAFEYYRDHYNPEAVYACEGSDILFIEPIKNFGISPDFVTYLDGKIIGHTEAKCPEKGSNHLENCKIEKITPKNEYYWDLMAEFISGCSWIDFCSFDPRMEDGDPLKMHVVRLNRVDYLADIAAVEARMIEAERYINDWDLLKNL